MSVQHSTTTPRTIYFIQAGVGGPIKIGSTAKSIQKRLRSLQTGNPEVLRLVGVFRWSDPGKEHELHHKFRAHWIRGEWFAPAPEILDFVASHAPILTRHVDGPSRAITEDEVLLIGILHEKGLDPVRIARVLKRSRAAVYKHLDKLAQLEESLPPPRAGCPR